MKYGLTNLMKKHEDDLGNEGLRSEISAEEVAENVAGEIEATEIVDEMGASAEVAGNLTELEGEAREKLADESNTEEDFEQISVKLERDINSALALVGGSFLSGKYSPSAINPKIESDILKASGKRQVEMKVEGIVDFVKKIWEKIKIYIKKFLGWITRTDKQLDEWKKSNDETLSVLRSDPDAGLAAMKSILEREEVVNKLFYGFALANDCNFKHVRDIFDNASILADLTIDYIDGKFKYYKDYADAFMAKTSMKLAYIKHEFGNGKYSPIAIDLNNIVCITEKSLKENIKDTFEVEGGKAYKDFLNISKASVKDFYLESAEKDKGKSADKVIKFIDDFNAEFHTMYHDLSDKLEKIEKEIKSKEKELLSFDLAIDTEGELRILANTIMNTSHYLASVISSLYQLYKNTNIFIIKVSKNTDTKED